MARRGVKIVLLIMLIIIALFFTCFGGFAYLGISSYGDVKQEKAATPTLIPEKGSQEIMARGEIKGSKSVSDVFWVKYKKGTYIQNRAEVEAVVDKIVVNTEGVSQTLWSKHIRPGHELKQELTDLAWVKFKVYLDGRYEGEIDTKF